MLHRGISMQHGKTALAFFLMLSTSLTWSDHLLSCFAFPAPLISSCHHLPISPTARAPKGFIWLFLSFSLGF